MTWRCSLARAVITSCPTFNVNIYPTSRRIHNQSFAEILNVREYVLMQLRSAPASSPTPRLFQLKFLFWFLQFVREKKKKLRVPEALPFAFVKQLCVNVKL